MAQLQERQLVETEAVSCMQVALGNKVFVRRWSRLGVGFGVAVAVVNGQKILLNTAGRE